MITLAGAALAVLVAAGTALYIHGIAPPYPWSSAAFQVLLLICLGFALAFGR